MRATVLFLILLAPQEQSTEKLLEQLQSDRADERNRAEVELKIRGDSAGPELERTARGSDAETAARVRAILEAHAALRPIKNAELRRRLASGRPHVWTEALLETAKKPGISREDLLPLARHAVRGAEKNDQAAISGVVAAWRLTPAAHDLVPWLQEPNWEIRRFTEDAIEACGDRSVAPTLLDLHRKDPQRLGQVYLGILGRLGCREAIPDMVATIKVPRSHHEGGGELLGALAKMDAVEILPPLLHALRQGIGNFDVITAVALLAPEEILPSLQEAIDSDLHQNRQNAVTTLHQYYPIPAALPLLRKAAEDPNLRPTALQAIGRIMSRDSIPDLKKLLDDPSLGIRRSAAQYLAQLGDRSGVPELLRDVKDPAAAPAAMVALQLLDVREAIPAMTENLRSPATRAAAADALARMGVKEVRDTVLEMLKDSDAATRRSAAVTLTVLDGAKAIPRLIELLDDPDYNVAVNGAPQMLQFLKAKESAPKFLERFRKQDPNGSGGLALHYLACVSPEEARPVLLEALNGPFRAAAAEPLCWLRRTEDLPVIRLLLRDPDVNIRRQAAQALAAEGDVSAVTELMRHPYLKQVQFTFNSIRRPEICRAWKSKILTGPSVVASTYDGLAEVCRRGGIVLEAAPDVAWLPYSDRIDVEGKDLYSIVQSFAWNAGAAIVEEGKLTMLGPRAGRRFWLRWYAELFPGEGKAILADLEASEARLKTWTQKRAEAVTAPSNAEGVRAILTPALKALPGLEERLVKGGDDVWAKEFSRISDRMHLDEFKGVLASDLEVLAPRALLGSLTSAEKEKSLQIVAFWHFKNVQTQLTPFLKDPSGAVRVAAARACLALEGAKALPRVYPLLEDPDSSVRTGTVGALGKERRIEARPRLVSLMEDPAIRTGLLTAAGELDIPEAIPLLLEAARARRGHEVLLSLRAVGGPEIGRPVSDLLKTETDGYAATIMCWSLGSWGSREAITNLIWLLDNPGPFNRSALPDALRALSQLGAREAAPVILKHLQPGQVIPEAATIAAQMNLREAIPLLLSPCSIL
jgi:HEAT repeat protein